jgi:hypothetical protein
MMVNGFLPTSTFNAFAFCERHNFAPSKTSHGLGHKLLTVPGYLKLTQRYKYLSAKPPGYWSSHSRLSFIEMPVSRDQKSPRFRHPCFLD